MKTAAFWGSFGVSWKIDANELTPDLSRSGKSIKRPRKARIPEVV